MHKDFIWIVLLVVFFVGGGVFFFPSMRLSGFWTMKRSGLAKFFISFFLFAESLLEDL